MNNVNSFSIRLIAPCGINCGVCYAFLRKKNKCLGCRIYDPQKPKYCISCKIKNCKEIEESESTFCYECSTYPCTRLKQLDKRYRTKYKMSVIENLNNIKTIGLDNYIITEKDKWKCKECGGTICVHSGLCSVCGR